MLRNHVKRFASRDGLLMDGAVERLLRDAVALHGLVRPSAELRELAKARFG